MEQINISFTAYYDRYSKKIKENKYSIYVSGECIGDIEKYYDKYREKDCWRVHYDSDKMRCCGSDYNTIMAARKDITDHYLKYRIANTTAHKMPIKELTFGDNSDFFPTPSALIGRMLARVDWKNVKTILEPSAGKGNIIECVKAYAKSGRTVKGHYYSRDLNLDIDCIELDPNLRYILTGKGFRVVHDDFLTYTTRKRYDLIIMNPPFSNGDEHLIKALEMQEANGGQIVCLLNAETLRNAYTNRRKVLLKKLSNYGAKVEYVKDGFKFAERKTSALVALVYVNIPRRESKSEIFERMQKASEQKYREKAESRDVAPNDKVEALIRSYEIETAATVAFLDEYSGLAEKILESDSKYAHPTIELKIGSSSYGNREIDTSAINEYLKIVRHKYWYKLLSLPQLTDKMTTQMQSDYYDKLNEMSEYEFSRFNIEWLLVNINAQLWEGIDDEILKLFKTFTTEYTYYPECTENIHYYNGWKTNKAHKVNYKVIIPAYGSFAKRYDYDKNRRFVEKTNDFIDAHHCFSTLADLEKSLNYLDGNRTAECSLSNALQLAESYGRSKDISCKYFSVSFYKKGTCHIVFHKECYRLIDALNIYAARNYKWLPPSYGQKHYREMDDEEKKVIDEFQGEQAYETVMQDKTGYLIGDTKPAALQLA